MVVRVAEPGRPAFQLRKGEEGLLVFHLGAVDPPLTEAEIEAKGLRVVPIPGAEPLPSRLWEAHAEIRPGLGMTRAQFKQPCLKELE
ncbi:MAG: hypothetical protein IRY99_01625 [Isosphaeraceae bacterium]|nr:hypothetical protein [Isosphaeraceae bacterium]